MLGLDLPRVASSSCRMPSTTNPRDGQRTILVVDDFDDTRLLLRTWLEKKGYRVFEAENGNEAVDAVQSQHPDLIIMDVEMPELDGLGAIGYIMSESPRPIVVVSSYAGRGTAAAIRALELGAVDLVPKEEDRSELSLARFGERLLAVMRTVRSASILRMPVLARPSQGAQPQATFALPGRARQCAAIAASTAPCAIPTACAPIVGRV